MMAPGSAAERQRDILPRANPLESLSPLTVDMILPPPGVITS
jgi:hypothetical protein